MAFTAHGHQVPGTTVDGKPIEVMRCGGVMRCTKCRNEARQFTIHQPLANQIKAQWMVMEWVDAKFDEKFGTEVQKPPYVVEIVGFSKFGSHWQAYAETTLNDGYLFKLTYDAALDQYDIQVFERITSRSIID